MVVCEKRRYLTKDAKGKLYVKSDNFQVLRNRAVIEQSTVTESEQGFPETGIVWVVDEKATKEWHESKQPKKTVKTNKKVETKNED